MTPVRVCLGLLVAVGGAVWAAGGVVAIRSVAGALAILLPAFLLVLGVVILVRSVVPRGFLAGPLLLIALGAAGLAVRFELWRLVPPVHAGVAVVGAGIFIAMSRRRATPEIEAQVKRYWTFLTSTEKVAAVPRKMIVRVLPGHGRLDLRSATYPTGGYPVTVDCTVVCGHLRLVLPEGWQVQLGRVSLTWGMAFDGVLDEPDENSTEPQWGRRLLVLNIAGFGGGVTLLRG
jgi:hypothetical protein